MKRSNTIIFTLLVILTSVLFLTSTSNAQLVGGTTYPINGVENPPTSFNNLSSAVAYLTTNGVTGTGQVIMELAGGYPGEVAPVLIPSITGTNATLGITFRPATGTLITTSIPGAATPNQHAIKITGSYITLDGRAGGIGNTRDWTVRATGSGTTGLGQMAVRLDNTTNSMTGLVIRNLIMEGEASNTTGAIFQITGSTTNTISNVTIEQNLVQSAATLRGYGITLAVASNVGNTGIIVRNNVITQFYARGINLTGGFPGIEIYGNEIYHSAAVTQPTTAEFSAFYFSTTASPGAKIYNNYIHDIQLTNGTTAANGIYFFNGNTSGLPIEIFNNRVQIGNGITATTIPIYGIRDNAVSGSLLNIYFNSILVDGSPSAGTSNSAAFRKEVSNFINLKNNIFYNARSNSGGTGVHWGISVNNTTFASINNNDYFANGTGGVLGTTTGLAAGNKLTLSEWKSAVVADANSVSQIPNYVAGLKIDETIATQLESGGAPIAGILTDFEGNTRSVTTPDIGADEFNGLLLDLIAPNIVVTPLLNQSNTTSVSLTALITDVSGIDTAPNLPRMYLKKGINGIWVFDNNPTINGSNYTFTINYSGVGGVVLTDTIYYYLAAQDLLANAGTKPAGGSGSNPPGTTPPVTLYSYLIVDVPLSGTYTVGLAAFNSAYGKNVYTEKRTKTVLRDLKGVDAALDYLGSLVTKENGGLVDEKLTPNMVEVTEEYTMLMENGKEFDQSFFVSEGTEGIYPTLTSALTDLLSRGVAGPVTFSLVDALYSNETYPIVLPQVTGMSSTNTVTIKPASGINAEIPGSPTQTSSTIQVAGGDYYIIDGSNTVGGTTQNLKIAPIAIGTIPTIHLFSSANNNIFKNLIVEGKNTSAVSGSFLFGSGDPSNNNLIDNCIIKDVDSSIANHAVGLYFFSSIAYSNNTIQNSTIKNFTARGIYLRGAPATNLQVLNNSIYNTEISTAVAIYGLQVDRCDGTIITGNKIYDVATSSTSSSAVAGGLYFFGGSASGDLLFANNTISLGASLVTTTGIQRGIDYFAFAVNNFQAFYNTVFVGGSGVTDALQSSGIAKRDVANVFRLVDNIFYNERSNGTGTAKHYAISFDNTIATTLELNYNNYFANGTGSFLGKYGTTDISNITDWKTATTQDVNSISGDPLFVSDTDYRLNFLSPSYASGTPVAGITIDILGVTRSATNPSMGAYENPVATIGWANLQWPPNGTIIQGFTLTTYAQIWIDGITNQPGPGTGIQAWIGISSTNTDPSTWTTWVPATFNIDAGNNDEYMAMIGSSLTPGTYYYASRFNVFNGEYVYGGYNGGFWNGTTNVSGVLTVDPALNTLWERAAYNTTLPTWFSSSGNTERGLAYGKSLDGTEAINKRVFVASRNSGNFVKVLNAETGVDVGDLNTTGISGGLIVLQDVDVSVDGKIFACNVAQAGDLKVYMWDNELSVPTLALTYNTANRLGDKFTVIGDYGSGTAEIWAASATTGQHLVYRFTMTGGTFNPVPQVITCSDALTTGIASAAVYPLPDGTFYWNANGQSARKYASNGTLIGIIPGSLVGTGSNAIAYLGSVANDEYLATFTYGTGNQNARILKLPNGDPTTAVLYAITNPLGSNGNTNGAGDVDFQLDSNLTVNVYVLATNNGLGAYKTTTIIPVELTSFAANVSDKEISIVWSTATELNNRGFELERKLDADWQKVTFIEGRGTTTEKTDYSYSDNFKYEGFQGSVQYRLKQMDFDGTISYSNIISVDVNFSPKEFALYQNYPNPFNPSTTIKFALPFTSSVSIRIFNVLGEQVAVLFNEVRETGYHNVSFNASSLASGVYIYTIDAKSIDGVKNFNSVKKMMLVK